MRWWVSRIGWGLAIGSVPVWAATFAVAPFLPWSAAERATLAAALFAAGEVMFWLGAALAGPDVVARFRGRVAKGDVPPEGRG